MLEVNIYNVGQGDAILLQWKVDSELRVGIIDCNKFVDSNKIKEFLIDNSIKTIDFIVLTHFHYDHYSGFSEIFKCCIDNKIKIKYFLHTFSSQILDLYDQIFCSKKEESEIDKFFEYFDSSDLDVEEISMVDYFTSDIKLSNDIAMSFHAPSGKTYHDIAGKIHNKKTGISATRADINKLSTIIRITKGNDCILFTSDAEKKSFSKIRSRIKQRVVLSQIPHHGSAGNVDENFWEQLSFDGNSPAFVSVGDEPKDKLPKKETIKFFDDLGFRIYSTNPVYGISEYFNIEAFKGISSSLDIFSEKKADIYAQGDNSDRFSGDKRFTVFV
ncbi:MAG: MBL fold metallo-hydrolase [Bacteroidales bacterium]|nr:MBL fold metallo-hydrolase [Bacteroidales bacterium]